MVSVHLHAGGYSLANMAEDKGNLYCMLMGQFVSWQLPVCKKTKTMIHANCIISVLTVAAIFYQFWMLMCKTLLK